jgi:hypothetical protein
MSKVRKVYKEFINANIIGVTLEHNGYGGGDAGHGGFVRIIIEDLASTCMEVNESESKSFELLIRGDAERETFLEAFKMIVAELENNK